jgi:hypothetical protein
MTDAKAIGKSVGRRPPRLRDPDCRRVRAEVRGCGPRKVEYSAGYGLWVRAPCYWRSGDVVRSFRVEKSMASRLAESNHSRRDEEVPEGSRRRRRTPKLDY